MASFIVDIRQGHIQVEGEEDFVERVYADFRELLVAQLGDAKLSISAPSVPASESESKAKVPRKVTKRSGPSCASRIEVLKTEDFFDSLRTPKEVGAKLREKGTAYEGKHVAAALLNLTTSGKLRRVQEGGGWKYQNP